MVNPACHSRFSLFAKLLTILRLSAFLSTSASVDPRNFLERTIAESVFSPKDAEPAPMTVIFVGTAMVSNLLFQVCSNVYDLTIERGIKKDTDFFVLRIFTD